MYRKRIVMAKLHLDTDIKPVTEFRARAAELLDQVRSTGRPLVLTQRGHSAAVLIGVEISSSRILKAAESNWATMRP